jgi:hypothetical protein
VALR